jgi:hypothetical protein
MEEIAGKSTFSHNSVTGAKYGEILTLRILQSHWIIREYSLKQMIEKL